MKYFKPLALSLLFAVGIAAIPVLSRVQVRRQQNARRSQFASTLRNSTPTQIARDNPHWFAAAQKFDKSKANATAIFDGADRVEALRLFPVGSEKPLGQVAPDVPFFARHTVSDARFAARLGTLVLDAKSYVLPGQSTTQCYFEPAVAFRVRKNEQFTDTVICFKCDQLAVLEQGSSAPQRSIGGLLTGRFNIAGDFVVRSQLLELAKAAFRDDAAVQSIR